MTGPVVGDDGARVLAWLRALPGAAPLLDELSRHPGVHVVGGAVRDALLQRPPRELDFVVENDAAAVGGALGAGAVVHDAFGTVTVRGVDLASSRRERYPSPGALPAVETGVPLEEDLARRDFSVNAIAVRLEGGVVTEWPGAREDLAAETLRVLHPASFADDPTRLLRMARYAARLDFAPDPSTAALARAAVRGGALGTVSGSRLGAELRRLAAERQPAGMARLADHGVGEALLPGFDPAPVAAATALLTTSEVALAAALQGVRGLRDRLDALAFPAPCRDAILAAVRDAPAAAAALQDADWPLLRRLRPEAVALTGHPGAQRWLDELRHRSLAIDGDDLLAAGLSGPQIGEALDRAWRAHLDGRAPDRETQLAAALES